MLTRLKEDVLCLGLLAPISKRHAPEGCEMQKAKPGECLNFGPVRSEQMPRVDMENNTFRRRESLQVLSLLMITDHVERLV